MQNARERQPVYDLRSQLCIVNAAYTQEQEKNLIQFSSIQRMQEATLAAKPREIVGSKAFNIEYLPNTTRDELRDDIIAYLGEYRIKVQKFDYTMEFSGNARADRRLRDPHRGDLMTDKAKRSIAERRLRGDPTHREEAELRGLLHLEDQLRFTKDGDTIIYGSPPGPKNEGYGDYGYLLVGKMQALDAKSMRLAMQAIRIENPTIEQYNEALSALLGKAIEKAHADEFLEEPFVTSRSLSNEQVEDILQENFTFEIDPNDREMFGWIMQRLPIADSVEIMQYGTRQQKVQALNTLENYTLALKEEYKKRSNSNKVIYLSDHQSVMRLDYLIAQYGHKPPLAAGSCGDTEQGDMFSNNILSQSHDALKKALGLSEESYTFDKEGDCVGCGRKGVMVGPCSLCQSCDAAERRKATLKAMSMGKIHSNSF